MDHYDKDQHMGLTFSAHAAEISLQHDHVQASLVLLLLYQPGLTYYWCGLP